MFEEEVAAHLVSVSILRSQLSGSWSRFNSDILRTVKVNMTKYIADSCHMLKAPQCKLECGSFNTGEVVWRE